MLDRSECLLRVLRSADSAPESRIRWQVADLVILLALALSGPVAAQSNRFFNPDLDSDTVGWVFQAEPGSSNWDWEDRDGCEGSGSVFLSGVEAVGFGAYGAQCIPVFAGETLNFEMEVRPIRAFDLVQGGVSILYTTGGCEIPGFDDEFSPWRELPFGIWSRLDASFVVPAGSVSAWVAFQTVSDSPFDALLDGAYGAEPPFRIFSDDFEYGSTCRW
jgi:hypothetical protein